MIRGVRVRLLPDAPGAPAGRAIVVLLRRIVLTGLFGALISSCGSAPPAGASQSGAASSARLSLTDSRISGAQARLAIAPNNVVDMDQLASYYLQKVRETGDPSYYPKVQSLVDRALQLNADDGDALVLGGALNLGRHQFAQALAVGQRALTVKPRDAGALGVIGDAQIELGRYGDAAQTIQDMVNRHPDLGSYSRVSYVRELNGDVPGAVQAMRMAITAGGPYPENVAYVQVLLGNLFLNSGDLTGAEAAYAQAIGGDPASPLALSARGQLRAAQHRWSEAVADLSAAVAVDPLPAYVIALAETYEASGDLRRAGETYDLVHAEQQLYVSNGVVQDQELALFDADHHRDLKPALAAAERAVRDRPSVKSYDVLAWTLYQAGGRDSDALGASIRARSLGTRDATFYFHAGMIEARMGTVGDARRDLQSALQINPYFSELRSPLARATLSRLPHS